MFDWFWKMDQAQSAIFSAFSAFLAFLATVASAYAAWKGPQRAAKIAEQMRCDSEQVLERRRIKRDIFIILMAQRAMYYSQDAVRAFNLIDIVFIENRLVRDAWAELFTSFDPAKAVPNHEMTRRYRALLSAIAKDLSLGDDLRLDDFERVYFPTALQEEEQLRILQRRALLKDLLSPEANTAVSHSITSNFSPTPTE